MIDTSSLNSSDLDHTYFAVDKCCRHKYFVAGNVVLLVKLVVVDCKVHRFALLGNFVEVRLSLVLVVLDLPKSSQDIRHLQDTEAER